MQAAPGQAQMAYRQALAKEEVFANAEVAIRPAEPAGRLQFKACANIFLDPLLGLIFLCSILSLRIVYQKACIFSGRPRSGVQIFGDS